MKRNKMLNLKSMSQKLILFSICIILFTVIGIAIPMGLYISNTNYSKQNRTANEQLNLIDQEISLFYDDLDRNIDMFANSKFIKAADSSITSYKDKKEKYKMTPSKNGGIEQEIYESFANYADTHPGTSYVYMGTEDGGYIQWPEADGSPQYDPRTRGWYKDKTEKILRTAPYEDASTGSLIVSNVRTFKNGNGKVYGTIGIDVSSERITSILSKVKVGDTGYTMILHRTGIILADTKFPKNNLKTIKDMVVPIDGIQKVLDNKTSSFVTKIDGKSYYVNSIQSKYSDWVIVSLIERNEVLSEAKKSQVFIAFFGVTALLISIAIATIFSKKIVTPIQSISMILKTIADKKFCIQMDEKLLNQKDEIGDLSRSTNILIQEISNTLYETKQSAKLIGESSTQLHEVSQCNSKAIEVTAKAIESLAHKSSEQALYSKHIVDVLKKVEEDINSIASEVTSTIVTANQTMSISKEASMQMKELEEVKKDSIKLTNAVGKVVEEINDNANNAEAFTTTIESISSQTNLLALNASIEAARAGEAGRGFAIVAEEIRKLSEQTNQATIDIKTHIQSIKVQSSTAVVDMGGVKDQIGSLSEAIGKSEMVFIETWKSLEQLLLYIDKLSALSDQIAFNKEEMFSGLKKVMESIEENSAISEEVSAATEEESASMEEINQNTGNLEKIAKDLNSLIQQFKLNEDFLDN